MVLLECIRGGNGAKLQGEDIDNLRVSATKKKTFHTSFKKSSTRNSVVLRLPTINVDEVLDFKAAHEYSKACVPRRVYELDENGNVATDEAGIEIQRLRQLGDKGQHKLYSVCGGKQSHQALYDFGIGVGLYYSQLLQFSVLCAVLFAFNLPVMACNAGFKRYVIAGCPNDMKPPGICGLNIEDLYVSYYGTSNLTQIFDAYNMTLNVSASNTSATSILCPTSVMKSTGAMNMGDFSQMSGMRLTALQGVVEVFCAVAMLLFVYLSKSFNDKLSEKIDLSNNTAEDYSVVLTSPGGFIPKTVDEIKEAYDLLMPEYPVVSVALVYDNRKLFKAIKKAVVAEKNMMTATTKDIKNNKKPEITAEKAEEIMDAAKKDVVNGAEFIQTPKQKYFMMDRDLNYWAHMYFGALQEINEINNEIEDDLERTPKAAYVVFDSEDGARQAIALYGKNAFERSNICGTTHEIQRLKDLQAPEPHDLIKACDHDDAVEPSDLLWEYIGVTGSERAARDLLSWVLASFVMFILYNIILELKKSAIERAQDTSAKSKTYVDSAVAIISSVMIVVLNMALPYVMKATCSLEIHKNETSKQNSIMTKLCIVRFFNTAILTFLVTPADSVLESDLVTSVQAILIMDLWLPAFTRLLDVYNIAMRYGLGKMAPDQPSLNVLFGGTYWRLAERYTDISKTLFLCLFYASIVPSGYAIVAVCFLITYITDKYLLLRRWREPPQYGDAMTKRNRLMVLFGVMSHICVTYYFFRNWPFQCQNTILKRESGEKSACKKMIVEGGLTSYWPSYPSARTMSVLMIILMVVVVAYFLKETFFKAFHNCYKALCKADTGDHQGNATLLTYSTRETIDTYEPRLSAFPHLNRRAIYQRGEYKQCTGFSEYIHGDLCVALSSFCGRDADTNPWRFAGQTSYIWPDNLSKAEVAKWQKEHKEKDVFNSTKIFQIKFWKSTPRPINKGTTPNPLNQTLLQPQQNLQMMQMQQQQMMQMQQQQMMQMQQQQMAQPQQLQVTCPMGVGPGQQIQIQTPNGQRFVVIPPGVGPGMRFFVTC